MSFRPQSDTFLLWVYYFNTLFSAGGSFWTQPQVCELEGKMLLCFAPYKGEWPEINSSLTPTVYSSFFVFFFNSKAKYGENFSRKHGGEVKTCLNKLWVLFRSCRTCCLFADSSLAHFKGKLKHLVRFIWILTVGMNTRHARQPDLSRAP